MKNATILSTSKSARDAMLLKKITSVNGIRKCDKKFQTLCVRNNDKNLLWIPDLKFFLSRKKD